MNSFRTLPDSSAPGDRARRRRRARPLVRGAGVAALSFFVLALLATSAYAGPAPTKRPVVRSSPRPAFRIKLVPLGDRVKRLTPGVVNTTATASPIAGLSGTTIFYDGFESGMGNWALGGTPTWGPSSYYPIAGSYDAYCAGSLITQPGYPGPYANNMNAWMVAGPFDLSTVTSAALWYNLFVNTQPLTQTTGDPLYVGVSLDGSAFYCEAWYSGPKYGFVDAFDLTNVPDVGNVCGQSQVWIAFAFLSDATTTAEGAYVDEVSIQSGPLPDYMRITAGPAVVGYNKPVTIQGTLTDTWGNPLVNKSVNLYASTDNNDYSLLGSIDCPTGAFSVSVKIVRKTWFWAAFAGDSEYLASDVYGSQSLLYDDDIKYAKSRAYLTPPAAPLRVKRLVLHKYWGTLKPKHSAAQNLASHTRVYLYRYSGGKWRPIDSKYAQTYRNTTSATLYMVSWRLGRTGRYRMQSVHADADHAKTTSAWRYFRVVL